MNRSILCTVFVMVLIILFTASYAGDDDQDPEKPITVDTIDLSRYVGLWYEIAKIPNRFQRKCEWNTTAHYTLREDGKIDVVNRCIDKNEEIVEAKGVAKIVDPVSNSKLKVSFVKLIGISLFWGDYWIIGLDVNYEYAIVGTPDRKYGWILSRKPELAPEMLERVFTILQEQGYNPRDFEMTVHLSGNQ